MALLQYGCTALGQVFDTVCSVQCFDMATRADVEGSIEAYWKKIWSEKGSVSLFLLSAPIAAGC